MARNLSLNKETGSNDTFIDNDFIIDEKLKTLEFYNHNLEKKVFEIFIYGNGKTIYLKKKTKETAVGF